MILVSQDPSPSEVRQRVLLALSAMHKVYEYASASELETFLDDMMCRLERHDVHGLQRVILFFDDRSILDIVRERMGFGGTLSAFTIPKCWDEFGHRLTELESRASRFEGRGSRHGVQ